MVLVNVTSEFARAWQMTETFGYALFVAYAAVLLPVFYGMNRRVAVGVISSQGSYSYFPFDYLFFCHASFLIFTKLE